MDLAILRAAAARRINTEEYEGGETLTTDHERDGGQTTVTFLGTCANLPYAGEDCSSFVINERHMVDTGWYGTVRMLSYGLDPVKIEHLFFTHRHNDHTLGLPQLLLYRRIKRIQEGREFPPLKIFGPAQDLDGIVERAVSVLQWPESAVLPEVIPLEAGDEWENGQFVIRTCSSRHTAPGLVYRFFDKRTGVDLAFTGDTAYDEAVIEHVRGAVFLIHEACYNDGDPLDKPGLHSQPKLAARAAEKAGVGRLALIHGVPALRARKVAAAREIFPNTFWPENGQRVVLARRPAVSPSDAPPAV